MRLKFSTQQCSRWNCWCILHLIYWLQDGYSVPSKYEEMRHGYPLIGTSCSLTCVAFKMVGRFLVLKQWWHQASCWEFLMWIEPIWGNRLKCLSFKFPSLPFAVVKYRNRSVKWQSDCLRIIIFNLNCRFHMKLEHLMAMLHRNLQTMSVIRQSVKFMSSLIRTSKCLILIGQLRPYVQQLLAITCVILSLVPKASWLDLIGRFWCGQEMFSHVRILASCSSYLPRSKMANLPVLTSELRRSGRRKCGGNAISLLALPNYSCHKCI